jgi:hypothetical protein
MGAPAVQLAGGRTARYVISKEASFNQKQFVFGCLRPASQRELVSRCCCCCFFFFFLLPRC